VIAEVNRFLIYLPNILLLYCRDHRRMSTSPRHLRFIPSLVPLVALVAFVSIVAAASVTAHTAVLGPESSEYPKHLSAILSLPFMMILILGTWGVLRYEGVSVSAVGLSRSTFLPAVVAFGVLWGWVSIVGVGYLVVTGATAQLGFAFDMPWYWVPIWFLLTLTVSNGLTEEFVFRGYVQNKCTAIVSSRSHGLSATVGILGGAVLFGVAHIPVGLLLEGVPPAAIPWIILGNLIPGITYGVIYYLTQNVWYAGFVHGFGNATVVPFDPSAVPSFVPVAAVSGILIALGYRHVGRDARPVTIDIQRQPSKSTE